MLVSLGMMLADECSPAQKSSDNIQTEQQERILQERTSAVGMPAIHNFREARLLKDIYEMRDQNGITTYTYTYSEMTGTLKFLCDSIGYAIPYSTQFTSPQKIEYGDRCSGHCDPLAMPQADPNGLFSPGSAEGTWVMCKNPHGAEVKPVYVEPKVITSPFPLVP